MPVRRPWANLATEFYTDCSHMNKSYKCLYFCRLSSTCHCTCLLVLILFVHSWCIAGKWIHIRIVRGKTNGISTNSQCSRNRLDTRWPHCRCKLDVYIFVAHLSSYYSRNCVALWQEMHLLALHVPQTANWLHTKISTDVQIQIRHTWLIE